jgi:hypothetical protein
LAFVSKTVIDANGSDLLGTALIGPGWIEALATFQPAEDIQQFPRLHGPS